MHRRSIRVVRNLAFALFVLAVPFSGIQAATPIAGNQPAWPPSVGATWQIQLTDPLEGDPLPVRIYDLDGFDNDATTVEALHAEGIGAICYFSAGTWEDWRPDAESYPPEIIGNAWDEWAGEKFVDIRRIDLLAPILEARLDMCVAKGFDAVDPDMIDTYGEPESVTGFPLTEEDQLLFDRWLADAAHARGLAVGQKNVPELTSQLVDSFDFAVTEDCLSDGWCDQDAAYLDAGKPVFAIEYTDRMSESEFAAACAAQTVGFSFVLKHRDLDAWRVGCP